MRKSGIAWTLGITLNLLFVSIEAGPLSSDIGPRLVQERAHPSLAGHWVLSVRPAGEIPAICRVECVITQDEKTLTVRDVDGSVIQSYLPDGPAQKTTKTLLGRVVEEMITSRWEGQVLLIDRLTVVQPERTPSESHLRVSLESGKLVFERTMKSSTGGPVMGRGATAVRIVYELKK